MATVHLICGLPSAGKTTYAMALAQVKTAVSKTAVHLRLDHWLTTAYGNYTIDIVGHNEHVRRVFACRALIWGVAQQFLHRDIDVILDDGFFLREHRQQHIVMAQQIGANVTIHFLNTPKDVIEARLEKRNRNLPSGSFAITPAMLGKFYDLFEAPSAGEGAHLIEVKGN